MKFPRPTFSAITRRSLAAAAVALLQLIPAGAVPIPLNSGTAAQSSQLGGFAAGNALDAVVNFTHTLSSDTNPTWQVLLPQSYSFGQIVAFNRQASGGTLGCCPSRLRDITIEVVDFSGNVGTDFTGGTVVYSSPLLNPENVLGGGVASGGAVSLSADAAGAVGNLIRIKRTPDPDLSGSGGAGNADEASVLSLDLVTAEGSQGISRFTASPTTIAPGAPVTLSWAVAPDVTGLAIDQGVGNVWPQTNNGTGSIEVDPGPQVTTSYTLTATSAGAPVTAAVTVTVEDDPIIRAFGSNHTSVSPGTDVTLTWDVENFDSLRLNGAPLEGGGNSLVVSPLVTTTYTLEASNARGSATAALTVTVIDVPDLLGASGRFIEVVKNDINDTRLHLAEIEVFQFGVNPNDADADGTSSNDLVQNGSPATVTPPTTTSLEHGSPGSVFDGDIESGAEVWSTANGLGTQPRYLLDLGATNTINTVRIFGRGDNCCLERLQNFTVNLYADDGSGNPGALVNSVTFPGVAPSGGAGNVELSLAIPDPGIRSFSSDKSFIPQGEAITLSWEVNTASTSISISGIGDVTAMTDGSGAGSVSVDPGPVADTTYTLTAVRPNGTSTAQVSVEVTDQPLIYSFEAAAGIVSPGTPVALTWQVANATGLDLNGTDVTGQTGASVMPASTTSYTLTASNPNGSLSRQVRVRVALPGEPIISEFMADNATGLPDEDGEPSDWIELCNPTGDPAALDGYFLTDDPGELSKWRLPAVTIAPGGYLVVFASGNDRATPGSPLHTNFSLARGGEYLALVKPDGVTVVSEFSPTYPAQRTDVSYGFDAVALIEGFFLNPTPAAANAGGFTDFVADTRFSVDRGFYDAPISVEIASATPGAQIRYTVDGSKPTATTGLAYTAPVPIARTTVLRAAAFKAGHVPTNIDTHTYIFPADVIANPNMRTSVTRDPVYGPQMADALRAVPTISLVFAGDVERTEKEASVELINFEAGDTQLDAGMERFGNYVTNFAKRGMRLNFRTQYGPGKLSFPVFDGHGYLIPPAAKIDSVDLRSGNHDMSARGAYMSNRFTDDSMLDMGNIAPHGRFVHVYLNGLYWGQYHMRERWSAAMLAEYYGGVKADYEAINANDNFSQNMRPYDGTGAFWNEAQALVTGPQPFASARGHIDMANIFDFMLLWASGNSESEFRSAGSIPLGVPFKFFMKDADGYLRSPGNSVTHAGPINLMAALRAEGDPDYKVLLADEIHRNYFNDGAFTPAKNIERLQERVDEIAVSFLAESARWGEQTPNSWRSYQTNLINNHFPGLTATMIGRFRSAGYYPDTVAPSFSQHGGSVPPGFQLAISAPAGTIYYTLDGSDPRVSAEPVEVDPPVTVVAEAATKSVYVPTGASDGFTDGTGKRWNELGFDDGGWTAGSGGVGYERGSGYENFFSIDVGAEMADRQPTCLIRIPFTVAAGALAGKTGAEIRVRYDDAYVAYLNGTEVARKNFAGTPDGASTGTSHADGSAVVLESVDISANFGLLTEGANLLAIHGINTGIGSSDFLISADLRVSAVPTGGGVGGAISPTAIEYTGTVPIASTTRVRARVFDGASWSALNESTFVQDSGALVISEIMYNPSRATAAEIAAGFTDSEDFEFLELLNTGSGSLDLTGLRFTDGISFDFAGSSLTALAAGARLVIVEDLAAFEFRYGSGLPVAGQYAGKLKDEGEHLQLVDGLGGVVRAFAYDNLAPWPTAAAGQGPSLLLVNPESAPDHADPANWTAGAPGGTPGTGEVAQRSFAEWAALNGVTQPDGDEDRDHLKNLLEFFMGGDPNHPSPELIPSASIVAGNLTLTFQRDLSAGGLAPEIETSADLDTWTGGTAAELVSSTSNGDGTVTVSYRSSLPPGSADQLFIRLRVSQE